MIEKQFESNIDSLTQIQGFFDLWFQENSVDEKISAKIFICIDEIISNIIYYSGASTIKLQCECEKSSNILSISFIDDGKAFNPLTDSKTPDTTASIMDRQIGGLGIYMVKKMMSKVEYERTDNHNKLTITKNMGE